MQQQTVFEAHENEVLCVRFTPDGARLVSSGRDGVIRLWNTADWSPALTLTEHSASVNSVAVSQDGSRLLSGSSDQTVRLWSLPGGRPLFARQDRRQTVADIDLSASGTHLAAVSSGGRLAAWDNRGKQLFSVKTGARGLTSVAFNPDGTQLATTGQGGSISIWSMPSGTHVSTLTGHQNAAGSLRFLAGGRVLASLGSEGQVIFWDTHTWQPTRIHQLERSGICQLFFSADQRRVALPCAGQIQIRDAATWTPIENLAVSASVLHTAAFSPDGGLLAVGTADHMIHIFA